MLIFCVFLTASESEEEPDEEEPQTVVIKL